VFDTPLKHINFGRVFLAHLLHHGKSDENLPLEISLLQNPYNRICTEYIPTWLTQHFPGRRRWYDWFHLLDAVSRVAEHSYLNPTKKKKKTRDVLPGMMKRISTWKIPASSAQSTAYHNGMYHLPGLRTAVVSCIKFYVHAKSMRVDSIWQVILKE
jgi:hypothetical protein